MFAAEVHYSRIFQNFSISAVLNPLKFFVNFYGKLDFSKVPVFFGRIDKSHISLIFPLKNVKIEVTFLKFQTYGRFYTFS